MSRYEAKELVTSSFQVRAGDWGVMDTWRHNRAGGPAMTEAEARAKVDALNATAPELQLALRPFADAFHVHNEDSLGQYTTDKEVIHLATGSWGNSAEITFGDLRRAAEALEALYPPKFD